MITLIWCVVLICAALGELLLVFGAFDATGAPQQAAAAAMAVGIAVIPYVGARAIESIAAAKGKG